MHNYMESRTIYPKHLSITLCLTVDILSLNLLWAGRLAKSQIESAFLHPN